MSSEVNIWQLARRANLLKTKNYRISLKNAANKENCRKHAFYIRFYYKGIKRPGLRVYTPLRNWVVDYYEVSKDLAQFAKKSPFKGKKIFKPSSSFCD